MMLANNEILDCSYKFTDDGDEPIYRYVKPEYHQWIAPYQVTVHLDNRGDVDIPDHPGVGILSDEGVRFLAEFRRRVAEERPKATIRGRFERSRTGAFTYPDGAVCLCTFNNLVLEGYITERREDFTSVGDDVMHTSTIVMYDVDLDTRVGHAITKSGSLYKFILNR